MSKGQVLQRVDVIDIVNFIKAKNKRIQAVFLSDLEKIIPSNSEDFLKIRKLYLDCTNGYQRSVLTTIFGDVED